jgi:hypothetical protein
VSFFTPPTALDLRHRIPDVDMILTVALATYPGFELEFRGRLNENILGA